MAQNIIFLFSQPRSGSTLLQRILASHPQIISVSETWLLLPQLISLQPRRMVAEYNHTIGQLAVSDFIKELQNGRTDYNDCLREFMLGLYSRTQASAEEASYFLEKTPRYYLIIKEIAEVFPEAKFIFLFRNPLSVMSSVIKSWHQGRLSFGMHYTDIFQAPQLLTEGYKSLHDRSVRINFEDLIRKPDEIFPGLFSYLGLEYDENLAQNFQQTQFRRMQPSEGRYQGLEEKTLTEWQATFNTKYRIQFARRYIERLGRETLEVMGIDFDTLTSGLANIESHAPYQRGIRDRVTLFSDRLASTIEWPFMRRRAHQRLHQRDRQQFYL